MHSFVIPVLMDCDKKNQQSSNYQPPIQKIPPNSSEYSYTLRNDLFYSIKEFKELETAYREVCEELDQVKLGKL